MKYRTLLVAAFAGVQAATGAAADAQTAAEQAAAVRSILATYQTADPQSAHKKLRIICWRTREREFPAGT